MRSLPRSGPPALALLVLVAGCSDSPTDPGPGAFTDEEIEYYLEVALGSEVGGSTPVVRKWTGEVTVRARGEPGDADVAELEEVMAELNDLREGTAPLRMAEAGEEADVNVHFAPESEFAEIEPNYVPVNLGFFWVTWDGSSRITSAVVLIDNTDRIDQETRNHLVREEMTQMLGLMRDSPRHPGSIFYDEFRPAPTDFLLIDRAVIRIHGRPEVLPGMTEEELREVLPGL